MITPAALDELRAALAARPDQHGGDVLVLATEGPPPALALVTSFGVALTESGVRVGVQGQGAAANRLGGSFALLVPRRTSALRVEVAPARSRMAGPMAVLEGPITAIRPTAELPWELNMAFTPNDPARTPAMLEHWAEVHEWLESGAEGAGPALPR